MSKQKWVKRGTPKGNVVCVYTSSRTQKKTAEQDASLAQLGLTFEGTHSIDTMQFGSDQTAAVKDKIAKAINWNALKDILVASGTPEKLAKLRVAAAIDSINLNADINEIVREHAVETYKLGADFWGTDDNAEPAEIEETVAVAI